jgi:PAS domain S-box-containing protein
LITDALPALISYVDARGRYRFNNKAYENWFGLAREGISGKHLREVLGEAAFQRIRPYVETALSGQRTSYEDFVPYGTGGMRHIHADYVPDVRADGSVAGFYALVTDITEPRRAQQALSEALRRQEALYEFVERRHRARSWEELHDVALDAILSALRCDRASILLYDAAGVMRFVRWRGLSDHYRRTTEGHSPWSRDEPNPQPISMADVAVAELDEHLRSVIRGEGIGALAFIPLVVNGRLIGKFMVYYDCPHVFEEEEVDLALTIARQVALGVEGKRAEEALKEGDRRKDEFLAMLSHELRNPLAPITTAAQVIEVTGPLNERQAEALGIIRRQSAHLTRLVDDLLDVSRITQGTVNLRPEVLDLRNVLSEAIKTTQPLFESKRHSVTKRLGDEPLEVFGDAARLTQVFVNLLSNAGKYTLLEGRIEIRAEADDEHVIVTVEDNGVGIDPSMLGSVFDLFVQSHSSLARSEGGLGVGLTLARKIVKLHEGELTAHSEGTDRGSRFVVRLLRSSAAAVVAAKTAEKAEVPAASAAPMKILIVDDNVDAANTLGMLLLLEGHRTRIEHDGPEGLAALTEWDPDLVLLDIGLPRMGGYEVAEKMRQNKFTGPVVAITGYGRDADRLRSARAGFDDHLVKPVAVETLKNVLAKLSPAAGAAQRADAA